MIARAYTRKYLTYLNLFDMFDYTSTSEVIEYINNLADKYNSQYESLEFQIDDDKCEVLIYGKRPETDEEYAARIDRLEKEQDYIRIKELAELKRLKEKYEND